MNDWVDKYNEIAYKFNKFGKSLKETGFHKEEQAVETFALMCIKLCMEDATAIALLLEKALYCEAMMILRSSLELLFKIHWVQEGDNHDEQNERTFRLESKPFSDFQDEVNYLKRSAGKDPVNDKEVVKLLQDAINKHKADYPNLVNSDGKFKTPPKNTIMAGDMICQKFYQVYRYLCIFTHPTPILRDFILSDDSGEKVFRESIEQTLSCGIFAYELIMGFCSNILTEYVPETHELRQKLYNEIKEMVNETK
ncbi:MAG: hypothetical protein KAW92_00615 [Candidatus Cloacimonetes bacterium]|nr:hypothetical protein [Candidatus Cloacimonadota bacterium]